MDAERPNGGLRCAIESGRWGSWSSWSGEDLHREVRFVDVGGTAVYASLYAHPRPAPTSVAVLVCQSWGIEADQTSRLAHGLALEVAELGGVACLAGYPGYGDSGGELETATLDDLVHAVCACADAQRHHGAPDWLLVGIRLGAAVAVRAAERLAARRLLLVQPALDVPAYFRDLARRSRRGTLGTGDVQGYAFGYPVAADTAANGPPDRDANVLRAAETAVIRYPNPPLDRPLPDGAEDIVLSGVWGLGYTGGEVYGAAVEWIRAAAGRAAASAEGPA